MRKVPAAAPSIGAREVHSISTLPPPPSVDRDRRMRTYAISMGIRTVCFAAAAVVTIVEGPAWVAWVLFVAAIVLPYPAVVAANNVNRRVAPVEAHRHVHRELLADAARPEASDAAEADELRADR